MRPLSVHLEWSDSRMRLVLETNQSKESKNLGFNRKEREVMLPEI